MPSVFQTSCHSKCGVFMPVDSITLKPFFNRFITIIGPLNADFLMAEDPFDVVMVLDRRKEV